MSTYNNDDRAQHGIDDNPNNDAEKGAALGGLGGAAVGAAAGSLIGPVGTVVGAVAGGLLGAGASGAAVAAIDQVDNDNTVSGLSEESTTDFDTTTPTTINQTAPTTYTPTTIAADAGYQDAVPGYGTAYDPTRDTNIAAIPVTGDSDVSGHNIVTGEPASSNAGTSGLATGAVVGGVIGTAVGGPVGAVVGGTLGSLAGGVAGDAAEAADSEGGEFIGNPNTYRNDETTGINNYGGADINADTPNLTGGGGNDVPGVQTGGITTQGSDTRGISEKTADAITGDRTDDKTGGRVL